MITSYPGPSEELSGGLEFETRSEKNPESVSISKLQALSGFVTRKRQDSRTGRESAPGHNVMLGWHHVHPNKAIALDILVCAVLATVLGCLIFALQPFGARLPFFMGVAGVLGGLQLLRRRPPVFANFTDSIPTSCKRFSSRLARHLLTAFMVSWLGLIAWAEVSPGGQQPAPEARGVVDPGRHLEHPPWRRWGAALAQRGLACPQGRPGLRPRVGPPRYPLRSRGTSGTGQFPRTHDARPCPGRCRPG